MEVNARQAQGELTSTSHWWSEVEGGPARPELQDEREADVCIVGGGFTGLWTAYELLRAKRDLEVVVVEARSCGFGASGRNAGNVSAQLAGRREVWASRPGGRDGVLALEAEMRRTVDRIGEITIREGIECDFTKSGILTFAESDLQISRLRSRVDHDRIWGLGPEDSRMLSRAEVEDRISLGRTLGGHFMPHAAIVQPAKLLTGLAAAVERYGGVICENSPATTIKAGQVKTERGTVRAEIAVRATEGYTATLPSLRRTLLPLNATMIATERLDRNTWESLGWGGQEMVVDGNQVYYSMRRTPDGRITMGGRGVPYQFGSGVMREGPVPERTVLDLRRRLVELFPLLEDVPIGDAWHGILGLSRTWTPAVGLDRERGLAWAGGYFSTGLAAANLAGRTLRDLILTGDSRLTRLPWVGQFPRPWEIEPLRFLGVRGIYGALAAADRRERMTGKPSLIGAAASRLAGTHE